MWCIDSWRVLWAWSDVHQHDNTDTGRLLEQLNAIKRDAGGAQDDHAGAHRRGEQDEGTEGSITAAKMSDRKSGYPFAVCRVSGLR